jgi:hypothetical protein
VSEDVSIGVQLPTVDGFGCGHVELPPLVRSAEVEGFDSVWFGGDRSRRALRPDASSVPSPCLTDDRGAVRGQQRPYYRSSKVSSMSLTTT